MKGQYVEAKCPKNEQHVKAKRRKYEQHVETFNAETLN
jgi:hypothetical protein